MTELEKKEVGNTETDHSLLSQLTEAMYYSVVPNLVAVFLVVSILFWGLRDVTEEEIIFPWYLGVCCTLLLRVGIFFWYQRTKLQVKLQKYHYYSFILGTSLTALFLGVLGSFLMPHDIIHQAFVLILLSGLIAGATQSLAASFLANISYVYLVLLPILTWELIQILENNEIYVGVFLAMSIFCVYSFVTTRRENLMLVNHLKLENNYRILLHSVSEMQEIYKEQATHDVLTGLYNRQFLNGYLEIEFALAKRNDLSLSVIMIDIDFFKKTNDRFGHDYGDEVLQAVGKILLHNIRKSDVTCRYGGEEFMIILPNTSFESAYQVAEKIRNLIKNLAIPKQEGPLNITASFGVSTFPLHGQDKSTIIKAADMALYKAKSEGRDKVCMATTKLYNIS